MADDKLNGNAKMILHNRTRNIINLDGFTDYQGQPLVLGTEADRGLIGVPQPEAEVKVADLRKMRENPTLAAMMDDHPRQIEAKQPFRL